MDNFPTAKAPSNLPGLSLCPNLGVTHGVSVLRFHPTWRSYDQDFVSPTNAIPPFCRWSHKEQQEFTVEVGATGMNEVAKTFIFITLFNLGVRIRAVLLFS